jgi:uncharacterized membrane protein required for colicin V production
MSRVLKIFQNIVVAYLVLVMWIFMFAGFLEIDRSSLFIQSGDDILGDSYTIQSKTSKKLLLKPKLQISDLLQQNSKTEFIPSIKTIQVTTEIFKPPKLSV